MLINTATLRTLQQGLQKVFDDAWNGITNEQVWSTLLATDVKSTSGTETYALTDSLIRLRKFVGERYIKNVRQLSFDVKNDPYEGTVQVTREDLADDKLGLLNTQTQMLARAARLWPNDLVYAALLAGGSTVCYDGQYFFDTDHPLEVQGEAATTQANLYTTTALTMANYATVRAAMRTRKGSDGKPLQLCTGRNLLIVPAALEETGKRICSADFLGYLSNNSSTASDVNIWKNASDLLVLPELDASSATTWYLADVSMPMKPFVFQLREQPNNVTILAKETDPDVFWYNKVTFGVYGRGASGYGLWQLMSKCTA